MSPLDLGFKNCQHVASVVRSNADMAKRKAGFLLSILVTDLVQAWVGKEIGLLLGGP